MICRLNLEHIRAICRLHPLMMRDGLIKRIDTELMEASKVEGKELVWKSSLEALRRGILDGLLAWLPLDVCAFAAYVEDVYSACQLYSFHKKPVLSFLFFVLLPSGLWCNI